MTTGQKLKIAIKALEKIRSGLTTQESRVEFETKKISHEALLEIQSEPVEVKPKAREFWLINKDLGSDGKFTPGTFLCSSEKPAPHFIKTFLDEFIHVREILDGGDQ